jgi:biofilm protein TabA
MKHLKFTILIFSVFVFNFCVLAQSSNENWTKNKASKWFNSYEWAHGMTLKASESVNQIEFAKQYHQNKPFWDLAFEWLKNTDLETIAVGKYVLDSSNVTVTVTEGSSTKDFDKTTWEGHGKYVDIQYIVKGKEKMGIAPIAKTTVAIPYDAIKDNGFYSVAEADSKYCVAQPGTFLIFFPSDAHRPNIKVEGYDTVRKIVFKIRAATSVDLLKRHETEVELLKSQKK